MPYCESCDAEYDVHLEACPECTDSAPEVVRCARCKEEFAGSDACPVCGTLRVEVPCAEHPERTAEGRCVVCGKPLCDTCDRGEARPFRCEEHRRVPFIEGWAQVYTTASEFEAQLVRENLRAEGIDAQTFSQKDHIYPVDMGELSIVRLLVPAWEYAPALQIIREHMDTEGEVVFACPACGEAYEPGSSACTSCGAPLAEAE